MPSQRKKPQQHSKRIDATSELTNFRLPSRPSNNNTAPSNFTSASRSRRLGGSNKQHHATKQANHQARKTQSHRMFPLHASANHRFVIRRQDLVSKEVTWRGPDAVVAWSNVLYVCETTDENVCSICLDDYVAPIVTKCGHSFCLVCTLQHLQVYGEKSTFPKCPVCSLPLVLDDTRPLEVLAATPFHAQGVSSSHNRNSNNSPQQRTFVKLHRHKSCPCPYLPQSNQPQRRCEFAAPTVGEADAPYCRFNYVDYVSYKRLLERYQTKIQDYYLHPESDRERVCVLLALQYLVERLSTIQSDAASEEEIIREWQEPRVGLYQSIPDCALVRRSMNGQEGEGTICNDGNRQPAHPRQLHGGSMYLDNEHEYILYQDISGQLCFLSGFNLNCLRTEYSLSETTRPPLPDEIHGTVIECVSVHLTPDIRQRRRFLSHLPLYIDIQFVELNINHHLSAPTKQMYQSEFQKRKAQRQKKQQLERKLDRKKLREEQHRIEQLKARHVQIDPNDAFFHVSVPQSVQSGDDFGPALPGSNSPTTQRGQRVPPHDAEPTMTFSRICLAGEAFPSLEADNTEMNFPSLGSTLSRGHAPPPPRPWGQSAKTQSKPKSKKKIVLLSTGGHRGSG